MNKTAYIIMGVGFALVIWSLLQTKLDTPQHSEDIRSIAQNYKLPAPQTAIWDIDGEDPPTTATPMQSLRVQSLTKMISILSHFSTGNHSLTDLETMLEKEGLEPTRTSETNEYTGTLDIVRNGHSLAATQYFHAQYLSDNRTSPFLQHMSFKVAPTPSAMRETVQLITEIFSQLSSVDYEDENIIVWQLENNYELWVRRLQKEDLIDDPFDAHTIKDVGTIQVAIELDLNGHKHNPDDLDDIEEHQHIADYR